MNIAEEEYRDVEEKEWNLHKPEFTLDPVMPSYNTTTLPIDKSKKSTPTVDRKSYALQSPIKKKKKSTSVTPKQLVKEIKRKVAMKDTPKISKWAKIKDPPKVSRWAEIKDDDERKHLEECTERVETFMKACREKAEAESIFGQLTRAVRSKKRIIVVKL